MVAICLKESLEDDFVKVGFRSNSVDVSEIAKSLGGGGHVRASGCNIKGSIESVKKAVLKATRKVL
jgi:phosphoesterase RecJ-like protein